MSDLHPPSDEGDTPGTIFTAGPNGHPKVIHSRTDCYHLERSDKSPNEHPPDAYPQNRIKYCPNCWGETDE